MKLFGRNLATEVAVIAEIGVNHEGDPDAALELLRLAAKAGADAVKFQSYTAERFASASDPARLQRVRRFALNVDSHRRLAREAENLGVAFFSTAVSEDWIGLLAELGEAVKIASGDLDFEPVLRAAMGTGRKVILSTGAGTVEDIDRAVGWCRDEVGAALLPERLALLHCVSAYPAPIEQSNLLSIPFLRDRYGLPTGWSNHVLGPDAVIASVALGAKIVEMHFTDRRKGREFRDHALSFLPDEFAAAVASVRGVCAGLGQPGKWLQQCEADLQKIIRKGVVAASDLPAGTRLEEKHLMYARPATEFASAELPALVGRVLLQDVASGELIRRSAVDMAGK